MNVKVVKFGGSSLADAAQFQKACDIIRADQGRRFVVDSAPGKRAGDDAKVTDLLYRCHREAAEGGDFRKTLQKIKARFEEIAEGLQLKSVDLNAEFAEIEKTKEQAEEQLQALARKADVKLPMTQEAMMKKMAAVREKYKAEFEEIDKLRQEDPQAARERTSEIFKREGIEMPMMGMGGFRRPEGNSQQQRQPRRGNSGQDMRKKMDQIRKAYPEEVKKLQALREEDPQKFRQEMKKLADRYDREHGGK